MFTGLISDRGTIVERRRSGENWTLRVRTGYDPASLELGESIAIDGACLTVTSIGDDAFTVDASPETLRRTTLGQRRIGDPIHLERALRLGDRLGGHLVLGHVDGVGRVTSRKREGNAWILGFDSPAEVAELLIDKGSITVDGVSLTVNTVDGPRFTVAIIPHTAGHTNLGDYAVRREVNLEADVLGKYVRKLLGGGEAGGVPGEKAGGEKGGALTPETLQKFGFS